FEHPLLPLPLETIDFQGRCIDGRVTEASLSAANGQMRLTARVADLLIPGAPGGPARQSTQAVEDFDLDEMVRELDVAVTDLPITPAAVPHLPEFLRFLEHDFAPRGPISFRYRFRKARAAAPGQGSLATPLIKEWIVEPRGMNGSFCDFRYPLRKVRGT